MYATDKVWYVHGERNISHKIKVLLVYRSQIKQGGLFIHIKRGYNKCDVSSLSYLMCSKSLLRLSDDSLESLGIVYSEVSENLAVDLDTSLVQTTHELRVRHTFETCSSIDTLNPESTESTLLVTTVTECIRQTLFPSILGNGPNILAGTIITASEFEDSLTLSS